MCKRVPNILTNIRKKRWDGFWQLFPWKFCKQIPNIYSIIIGHKTRLGLWDPKSGISAKIWQLKKTKDVETRRKCIRDEKIMISIFFSKAGIKSTNVLERNKKAASAWYRDIWVIPMLHSFINMCVMHLILIILINIYFLTISIYLFIYLLKTFPNMELYFEYQASFK